MEPDEQAERILEILQGLMKSFVPELSFDYPGLRNYNDLLDLLQLIKQKLGSTRAELTNDYFQCRKVVEGTMPDSADQSRAFNIAVRYFS